MPAAEIRSVKRMFTIQLIDAPVVKSNDGPIKPYKLEVVEYKDRGKVDVVGRRTAGYAPRTKSYRLYGTYRYDVCPRWVLETISEAGWSLDKLWGSSL